MKRFYYKWSVFCEAYAVYDSATKNPEGNDAIIATSDELDYTCCEELCNGLNSGDKELFSKYGLKSNEEIDKEDAKAHYQIMDNLD